MCLTALWRTIKWEKEQKRLNHQVKPSMNSKPHSANDFKSRTCSHQIKPSTNSKPHSFSNTCSHQINPSMNFCLITFSRQQQLKFSAKTEQTREMKDKNGSERNQFLFCWEILLTKTEKPRNAKEEESRRWTAVANHIREGWAVATAGTRFQRWRGCGVDFRLKSEVYEDQKMRRMC